jgi:hypothetical protein
MPAKCDQVVERLSPQFVGIKKIWRPTIFVVDFQFLATAASLAAVVVFVKPLLALRCPGLGGNVLAVAVAGWFFHGDKSKGAEAPCPCQTLPRRTKPRRTMPHPEVAFRGLPVCILSYF